MTRPEIRIEDGSLHVITEYGTAEFCPEDPANVDDDRYVNTSWAEMDTEERCEELWVETDTALMLHFRG